MRWPNEFAHELEVCSAIDGAAGVERGELVEAITRGFVGAAWVVALGELALVFLGELLDVAWLRDCKGALGAVARDLDAGEAEGGSYVGVSDVDELGVGGLNLFVFGSVSGGVADEDVVGEDANSNSE